MTYGEWYVNGLFELLDLGGKQEDVERCVTEINNPTQAGLDAYMTRRGMPAPYLGMIPCGTCGEPYAVPDEPKLDEEMSCPSCKTTPDPTPPPSKTASSGTP